MRKPGIHLRILVPALGLITAATFALGALGIDMTRQFTSAGFRDRILFLARYLAINSEVGILVDDRAGLKRLATNMLSEDGVAKVAVFNKQGTRLVDVSREVAGHLSVVEAPVVLKRSRDVSLLFSAGIPAKISKKSDEETLGNVRITYSTGSIQRVMERITYRFIWFSAGLAALAGLFFYFISRSIVVQVTRLADAARQVAQGDFDLRIEPGSLPETRELAMAFNAMLDSLAKSSESLARADREVMRRNFLAEMGKFSLVIAHEVKNPLGIIKSSLDILKKGPDQPSSALMVEYMEDEIRRLNRLIEDFLAFARPAKPRFRSVDLNAVLKEVVSRFQLRKEGTDLEIPAEIPSGSCSAYADPDLLTRALANIIGNACEANNDRGTVRVTALCEHNTWIAVIEDEGKGIAHENLDKIFEPFFTTRSKGSGLGLAFAVQVVNLHGGSITADNREEGGARFSVKLSLEAKG